MAITGSRPTRRASIHGRAVRAERLDHRGVHRAFEIEFCAAGIDLTMRFADLLPPGGGPRLEFGLLLLRGGALDPEIAELLGGRRTVGRHDGRRRTFHASSSREDWGRIDRVSNRVAQAM
jgi:hypothetical protein